VKQSGCAISAHGFREYLKSRPLRTARKDHPEMDCIVVEKIKTGEIEKAIQIREMLVPIAKAGGSILNDFLSIPNSFQKSYERAEAKGVDNTWYKRFHKFREQIIDPEIKQDLLNMDETHRKKCLFELRKIESAVAKLLKDFS
jgi:hypothetical protein